MLKRNKIDELIIENKPNHIKWIEHKGKKILYIDYSNLITSDEIIGVIEDVNDYVINLGENEILMLVDVRNSRANEKIVVDALKNSARVVKPYTKKVTVVGVSFTQEYILTLVNIFSNLGIKPLNTIDDAKDWLVG